MDSSVEMKTGIKVTLSTASVHVAPETWRRARTMIEALLREAEAPDYEYVIEVKGLYREYESFPSPHLEITPGPQPGAVVIKMKARGGTDGTLWGSLRLPSDLNRERLLQEAGFAEKKFNAEGWVDAINGIPPGPRPERVLAGQGRPAVPVTGEPKDATRLGNGMSVPHPFTPSDSMTEHEPYARCLIELLRDAKDNNGVFSGKERSQLFERFFPGQSKSRKGLVTGVLSKLQGLGWIRRIGVGMYQVEQSFLERRKLAITIRPEKKLMRQYGERDSEVSRRGSEAESPSQLAEQLESVKTALIAEQQRLEGVIAAAEEDLAAVRKSLEHFNHQVQASLAPLVAQFLPNGK